MDTQTLVHLIYIHGFQGNDTTFQSFPTDLQQHLSSLPTIHPRYKIQSSLYPTYKSVKPISYATHNFLEWLTTQPPGPVILLGHSMGGLLAAEAATHKSILESCQDPTKRRIVALVAFDTPYLGMHPHVIISGISSLLPKYSNKNMDKGNKVKTAKDMNDERQVKVVDQGVTDDWEAFKREDRGRTFLKASHIYWSRSRSPSPVPSAHTHQDLTNATVKATSSDPTTTLSSPTNAAAGGSTSSLSPAPSPLLALLPPATPRSLVKYVSEHANDPLLRWVGKHSDHLLGDGKKWIVEHFQFGICMFDPTGLRERYKRLTQWDGPWINYWTITTGLPPPHIPASDKHEKLEERRVEKENDLALLASGVIVQEDLHEQKEGSRPGSPVPSIASASSSPLPSPSASTHSLPLLPSPGKATATSLSLPLSPPAKPTSPKRRSKHHFITLPFGLGSPLGGSAKWVRIPIAGAEDEVAAHTGLFMPDKHPEYDNFVVMVGDWVANVVNRL